MARFSFIIPVYNVKPYLKECLDSVLTQDFPDFEICIVDDGSTDGSESICDEYANRDNRVKVYHQANGGVSVARNKALDMAVGEYIWFVDSDDYILPGALEYLNKVICESKCDTIFFGSQQPDILGETVYELCNKGSFLASHICYCNPLMIFKRLIIEENDIRFTLGMKMVEDLEFQYKYLLHCVSPVAISFDFYFIRERSGSASRNSNTITNSLNGNFMILNNMLEYLRLQKDKGVNWMGIRMVERVKNYIKASGEIHELTHADVQKNVRHFIVAYRELGYQEFSSNTVKLAYYSHRIYYIFYRIMKLMYKFKNLNTEWKQITKTN